MPEFIFHIGMGKTGTTAVQEALARETEKLTGAGIRYAGMLFNDVNPVLDTVEQTDYFLFESSAEDPEGFADNFVQNTAERVQATGLPTTLISNEAISQSFESSHMFFGEVARRKPTQLIAYIRNPYEWLPSAYAQWGLRHKINYGPIAPFSEGARPLIEQYNRLLSWANAFPDHLQVRPYDPDGIVRDFFETIGVPPPEEETRALKRSGQGELYLRAVYNNRIRTPALPGHFTAGFLRGREQMQERLAARYDDFFSTEESVRIVEEHMPLFEELQERFGLDMTRPEETAAGRAEEIAAIREELIDFLVDVTISQSFVLGSLEHRLAQLEAAAAAPPAPE